MYILNKNLIVQWSDTPLSKLPLYGHSLPCDLTKELREPLQRVTICRISQQLAFLAPLIAADPPNSVVLALILQPSKDLIKPSSIADI